MTDINSLPIDDVQFDDNPTVNAILDDLHDNSNPTGEQIPTSSDEILDEISDAPSDDDEEDYEEEYNGGGNLDTTQQIIQEIKIPMIIAIIAFLINSTFIEEFILNIPFFGDGQLNMFGMILKAVLIGALFYIVDKYTF